ncbi:unnamed protein product [Caenorhabditis brenneri]
MNNETIHGKPDYLNYQFDLWTFPVLIASVPILYILPTTLIVLKIIRVYIEHVLVKKDDVINPHVFSIIVLQLVLSFFYVLADYFTIRLPSIGLLTNWCASQAPNHGLKMIYFLSVYFNYTAMLLPCLLSLLRSYAIFYPMRVSELKISSFFLPNLVFWISACTIANVIFYRKLKKLRKNSESKWIQKAEHSLTLTTLSMLFAHITNLVHVIVVIFYPSFSVYLLAIRPYGSDCDFVIVPWVFYLTHPMFKTRKIVPADVQIANNTHTTP